MNYRTVHGDTVDGVLWRELGRNDEQVVAAFWELNPDAAEHGPIFPAGIALTLPEKPSRPVAEVVRVWD
ncbi:tail protein X [Marinobacterium jannaschii]|uniref:tail protein X n=1 Tax=Marinobacterium jannaschii TaxID=64970 RepID=UPI00048743EF|nr:tail protein X [Marinobacterium jannaschii]